MIQSYPPKQTPLTTSINPLIEKRWSPVAFASDCIAPEKIVALFEAMRWAPSCYNEQPWRVIYTTRDQTDEFEQMASLLAEGNDWAKDAYLLMVVSAVPYFGQGGKLNTYCDYDTGAAIENLVLQASAMGLVAHQMAGFDARKAYKLYNIPRDVHVLTMIAIGHAGDEKDLPIALLERQRAPRLRKELSELVYFDGTVEEIMREEIESHHVEEVTKPEPQEEILYEPDSVSPDDMPIEQIKENVLSPETLHQEPENLTLL